MVHSVSKPDSAGCRGKRAKSRVFPASVCESFGSVWYRGTLGKSKLGSQRSQAVDESNKSKRTETREFWEEAIRLWNESGLSVRDFCACEGFDRAHFLFAPARVVAREHDVRD